MKQFNLQEYLEDPYRKIVTRDGRSIRIICTNRMNSEYPVVVLIREGNKTGSLFQIRIIIKIYSLHQLKRRLTVLI